MAKKRGGLAGLYDRNKKVIQKAAPVLAGMVGGPMAGAAVGAAMRGLDREGRSGIGFDVGQGMRGGLEGYAGGAAGKSLKGMFTAGMNKMGAASAAKRLASKELTGAPTVGLTAGAPSSASMYGNIPMPRMGAMPDIATQMASPVKSGAMDIAKKAGGFLDRNQQMLAGAAKGVAGVLGSRAEGQSAADQLALQQSKFDYEKQQDVLAQEKRRRLAQLTGQMFAPQLSSATPYAANNQRSVAPQMMDPYVIQGEMPKAQMMEPYVSEADGRLFGSPAGAANMYADPYMSMPEYLNNTRGTRSATPVSRGRK